MQSRPPSAVVKTFDSVFPPPPYTPPLTQLPRRGPAAVWEEFAYAGRDTCVADGLRSTVCPAGINVAYLTDHERAGAHGSSLERVMDLAARRFDVVKKGLRWAIDVGCCLNECLGTDAMGWATAAVRRLIPSLPQWSRSISKAPPRVSREPADPQFVYFPACVSRHGLLCTRQEECRGDRARRD